MEDITIYDIDRIVKIHECVIIHICLRNDLLGEFSKYVAKRVASQQNLECYNLFVDSFKFEEVLPTILLYKRGKLLNKLIGFNNYCQTLAFVNDCYSK